jgi:hypothetical protein
MNCLLHHDGTVKIKAGSHMAKDSQSLANKMPGLALQMLIAVTRAIQHVVFWADCEIMAYSLQISHM